MRAFERALGEQNPIIGDDAHGISVNPGEAGDQSLAVSFLELVEGRAVDDSGDDLAHVEGLLQIGPDDAVDLVDRVNRWLEVAFDRRVDDALAVQVRDDPTCQVQRVSVVQGVVVRYAGFSVEKDRAVVTRRLNCSQERFQTNDASDVLVNRDWQ